MILGFMSVIYTGLVQLCFRNKYFKSSSSATAAVATETSGISTVWYCHHHRVIVTISNHQQPSLFSSVIVIIATAAASAVSLATASHPQNPEVDAKGVMGSDGKKYVDGSFFHEEPSETLIADLCH